MPDFQDDEQQKKLATLHQKEEEDLARILSEKYGLGYADLSRKSINTDALKLITEDTARKAEMAGFEKVGKRLLVAVRTPNNERVPEVVEDLKRRGFVVELYMVSSGSLERAWEHYKDISFAVETKAGLLDISREGIRELLDNMKTLDDVRAEIQKVLAMKRVHKTTHTVETILAGAIAQHASDVHIEPEEDHIRIRYRLDGVLEEVIPIDHETYNLLLSRIKLLSGLKINIKDTAQDGRFSIIIDDQEVEIRTSMLPGNYGESIVMRILNPDSLLIEFEDLGMEPRLITLLESEARKPNGLILTTGPTGSGKTTTLYAILKRVHKPEIKIVTIEDPIEYHLEGIVQTQVEKEYSFNKGLTSTLRQDPDIIMVGEIRDSDVADTAIHASLTGHLVLSTLHTNNAAGAIPRLIDLGINPKILGSSVNIVLAQRLVRRLKQDCKKEIVLEGAQKELVDRVLASLPPEAPKPTNTTKVWEPIESPECGTGYAGRIGVYEAILMDSTIEKLARENPSERDIQEAAKQQGMLTMLQDGIIKVLNGMTTLSELDRVLDADSL